MPRNYKLEYEKRLAKVKAEGFSSPKEKWLYNKAKQGRTKKLTLYNFRQQKAGIQNKKLKLRAKAKAQKIKTTQQTKARVLKKFRLTELEFARLRRQNRAFMDKALTKGYSARRYYNTTLDADLNNWSEERVGYIKFYNKVFVNPKKKKTSAVRNRYAQLIDQWALFADQQEIIEGHYEGEKTSA